MLGIELTPEHPPGRLADLASLAEGVGFDAAFASHHYNNRDEFVALTAMAEATDEVLLGPGVVNPYETHPVTLASRMATLDEYSDGRGIFGVGAGDRSTLANLGVDREHPLRRVLETMQVARNLWNGERVDHDGTFAAVDAGLNYDVGEIPVYVGAQGPDMLRMAAKYADGLLVNASHHRDLAWATDRIAEGERDRPDDRGDVDVAAYASVSVAADAAAARAAARPPVAFIASGAAPPVLDRHGIDADRAADIGEAIGTGEFSAAFDLVTDPMLEAFCIAGTPETVESRLEKVYDLVDSVVVGSPLGPDLETAIGLAGAAANSARE
ncbi:5,10-methylenetetrahydromethanopterin reductase [Halobacteriales archaeon Cl-PHB]